MEKELPGGTIIETNSYYEGDRDTTEKHRETLKVNGWTFAPVDIMDARGAVTFPVKGGKWFTEMSMSRTLPEYDSLLALTHFKGHVQGGFGGSNKNLGLGCADGKVGKAMIHTTRGYIVCIFLPFLLLILSQGINSIRLFRKYKKEQQDALQAEKDKVEADRAQTAQPAVPDTDEAAEEVRTEKTLSDGQGFPPAIPFTLRG